jgi:cytochrome P450
LSTLRFTSANPVESIRFTAQVGVPNVLLGLFRKRELPTRVASRLGLDAAAYRLMAGLTEKYGPDPFYVNLARERTLLVHHRDDIRFVLEHSPRLFGSDPEAKRKGMSAFQPDALTISRGDIWESRRRFAEAVLDTASSLHRFADHMLAKAADEAGALRVGQAPLDWATLNTSFQRLTRRVVFGDRAADDTTLTEQLEQLMAAGNRMPGIPAEGYHRFLARIAEHLAAAEPGSLAALAADAPQPHGGAPGQVIHWLFAAGDTLAANAFGTLAVLGTHPQHLAQVRDELTDVDLHSPPGIAQLTYLAGCLQDTMRLWPTTTMIGRVALTDVRFPNGKTLPAGRPVLIINSFNHRNRKRVPYADRFAPEEWVSGDAGSDWQFNFFSHGPQGCPGAGMAAYLGQAMLAHLLWDGTPEVSGTDLSPAKPLPHSLDLYGLRVCLR